MSGISDDLLKDIVDEIADSLNGIKDDDSKEAFWQRLAYLHCLGTIKAAVIDRAEKFGLDGDLDKKFGLIK